MHEIECGEGEARKVGLLSSSVCRTHNKRVAPSLPRLHHRQQICRRPIACYKQQQGSRAAQDILVRTPPSQAFDGVTKRLVDRGI